jgi:hypothetical protein
MNDARKSSLVAMLLMTLVTAAHGADSAATVGERPSQAESPLGVTAASDVPTSPSSSPVQPISVVSIDTQATGLAEDFRTRLSTVAEQLRMDERSVVRLRSFLPDSGSLELGISMAQKTLKRVRDELIALGVKPVRILKEELREYTQHQSKGKRPIMEVQVEKTDRR